MNTADVEAAFFLGFEEDAELVQYFIEAWFWLGSGPQIQVFGVSPVIDDHFQFLLVHTEWVSILHDMLFEESEKFPIGKICKFDVNSMIFPITSHIFPQSRLFDKLFFGICVIQSLKKLVTAEHVPLDGVLFDQGVVDFELWQFASIWVMDEVKSVWSWGSKSTVKESVALRVFKNEM